MSNLLLAGPIYSDVGVLYTPTLSGGSWSTSLPLTNLQDRRLAKVARSSDATVASTTFAINLATTRTVKLVAIPKHTISSVGTIRVRGLVGAPSRTFAYDFSTGWSSLGTPTRSAAAVTGTDGVSLDLIGDDAAGTAEGYSRALGSLGNTAEVKAICFRVRQGTSTSSAFRVRDTVASANRLLGVLTWSGGLPVVTMTTGTYIGYTAIGGSFRLSFQTTAVTTGNTNNFEIYPAADSALTAANTGNLYCGDVELYGETVDRLATDSGFVTPWPTGLTAEDVVGINVPFVHFPTGGVFSFASTQQTQTYVVDINDTTNSAGYVDIARLVIAGGYQPTINMDYGAELGLEDDTTRTVTDGGAALYNTKTTKRRYLNCVLSHITDSEAVMQAMALQHQLGTSGQLFVVFDPADTTYLHKRAFLACFRSLSAFRSPYLARQQAAISLVEEL